MRPVGISLSNEVTFRDPLIVVSGRTEVLRMFGRLNRLFPASKIHVFEPMGSTTNEYELVVNYRRKANTSAHPFRTRLQIECIDNQVISLTEHWLSPIKLSAKPGSRLEELARRGFGRLLATKCI